MLDPWESLKVNPARQLLGAAQRPDTSQNFPGTGFSIYDISKDCAHPELKAQIDVPGMLGHTGQWAPDGNTYYVTPLQLTQTIVAIDTKDAANPKLIPCGAGTYGCGTPTNSNGFFLAPPADFGTPRWHDLEFSKAEVLQQRVAERTQALQEALVRAQSADQAKSILLSNVSHEMRTPLSSIIGFSNLILTRNPIQEKLTEYATYINLEARRLDAPQASRLLDSRG